MKMKKTAIIWATTLFLIAVALSDVCSAVTLHGKIYDIRLNELNNVVVEVNSSPRQRFVSKDGGYSFELNPGQYLLTANYRADGIEYDVAEEINVSQQGDYVYDLFLMPELDDDEILESSGSGSEVFDLQTDTSAPEKKKALGTALIVLLLVVLLLIVYFFARRMTRRKQKAELKEAGRAEKAARNMAHHALSTPDNKTQKTSDSGSIGTDLSTVVDIIRREGGRTTQKELRRQIPLSEAKISLMIAELEHKGVVQKVKKGRGNLLILRK
jgi:uncharacterized membrane protein